MALHMDNVILPVANHSIHHWYTVLQGRISTWHDHAHPLHSILLSAATQYIYYHNPVAVTCVYWFR